MQSHQIGSYFWSFPEDKEKPDGEKTILEFNTLSFEQDTWLEDKIDKGEPQGTAIAHILHMGLKDVACFKDAAGNEIKAERDEKSEFLYPGGLRAWKSEFLSHFTKLQRAVMALEIRGEHQLKEADAKN